MDNAGFGEGLRQRPDFWLAVHAVEQVAKTVKGEITGASLLAAVQKAKCMDLYGLIKWCPGKRGPAAYPRLTNAQIYLSSVASDGSLKLLQRKPIDSFPLLGVKG
jgi:hypothetical protein